MQLRNCAEVFRSCRRRSHDDGWGESLCLCCSRDSLEALWNAPQSEMRRGDRQRIPRNESPKTRLFARGTGGFESISLQQRVSDETCGRGWPRSRDLPTRGLTHTPEGIVLMTSKMSVSGMALLLAVEIQASFTCGFDTGDTARLFLLCG